MSGRLVVAWLGLTTGMMVFICVGLWMTGREGSAKRPVAWLGLTAGLMGLILFELWVTGLGYTAEVYSTTGDIRYRFLGWTYRSQEQQEWVRGPLSRAAALPAALRGEWLSCGDTRPRSNNAKLLFMCYWHAALWAEVDIRITRLMVDDITSCVRRWKTWRGLTRWGVPAAPDSWELSTALVVDDDGRYSVSPDWREDIIVRDYLEVRGYWEGEELVPEDSEGRQ